MPRRELDIPSLDGLRAVSIGLVFGAHAGWPDLIPGGLGVTVFFVLSGYLITTLLRLQWERTRSLDLRGFYLRRAFRILPLSYLVLTVVLIGNLAGVLGSGEVHLWPTVAQYLQATNLYAVFVHEQPMMDGTGVYWSLSIEEHFYLVLPVALLAMSRAGWDRRRQARSMLVLCAVVLAWRFVLVYAMHAPIDRTYYGTDTRLDSLLLGCVAALVANPVLDRDIVHEARTRLAAHLGLVTIVATLLVRDDGFRETLRYTIQSVAIVAIVRWVVYAPARGCPVRSTPARRSGSGSCRTGSTSCTTWWCSRRRHTSAAACRRQRWHSRCRSCWRGGCTAWSTLVPTELVTSCSPAAGASGAHARRGHSLQQPDPTRDEARGECPGPRVVQPC
ncbi:MAG: acyltransferase [Ilumatobacteraceae bacterium]